MATTAPFRILVVDDDAAVGWALQQALSGAGYGVTLAADAAAAQRHLRKQAHDLVITDIRMPGMDGLELLALLKTADPDLPVVVSTAHGTMETAISAVGRGAFDYLPKPLDLDRTLAVVKRALGEDRLALAANPATPEPEPTLVGGSPAMQEAYRRIAATAATDLAVLITGPPGTGKELAARALHRYGRRQAAPFVAVSCGALAELQIDSDLFGRQDGEREIPGRIDDAAGGVLFLDEVADLSPVAQVRLLRLIEEQRFIRVDGNRELAADVRVIAASARDLPSLVTNGGFREDLAYRLGVATIAMPPLGERLEDLPVLVRVFIARSARRLGRQVAITDDAIAALQRHAWPGNVRELRHAIESAAVLATGGIIGRQHLTPTVGGGEADQIVARVALDGLATRMLTAHPGEAHARMLDTVEAVLFRNALAKTEGNQLRAAELLGINRITLKKRMDQLDLGK